MARLPSRCIALFVWAAVLSAGLFAQNDAAAVRLQRAEDAFYKKKDYGEAVKQYKAAVKEDQQCFACWRGLIHAQNAQRKYKDATESARKMVAVPPPNAAFSGQAHNLLGMALFAEAAGKKERLLEAEKEFREALRVTPSLDTAWFNLGLTLMKLERDTEGVEAMQKYVATLPPSSTPTVAEQYIRNPQLARMEIAPDVTLPNASGESVSLQQLRGKIVVIDFWATWCPPCVASVDDLKKLQAKYGPRGVVVVSISVDQDEKKWREFLAKKGGENPQLRDPSGATFFAFNLDMPGRIVIPSYVVIDRMGGIRKRIPGEDSVSVLEKELNKVLSQEQ